MHNYVTAGLSDATGGQWKRLDLEPSYAVSLATER